VIEPSGKKRVRPVHRSTPFFSENFSIHFRIDPLVAACQLCPKPPDHGQEKEMPRPEEEA
jgi:hypothetical protein